MADSTCPACHAPIDPTRAPVARVRGTKVVTFCSARCADAPLETGEDGAAVANAAGAASGVAVDDYAAARPERRGNSKRRVIAISSAVLLGGMVITIINAVSPSTPSNVNAASNAAGAAEQRQELVSMAAEDPAELVTPAEPEPEPDPLAPETLYKRAQETLSELMESPSPRVQRIAAMGLSRLGAAPAIEHLAGLLDAEPSELNRIEIAYVLARASDQRGKIHLLQALKHERRDIRLDAARSLVQLGDDTGNRVLRRMLSLNNHRIGAAALLARQGDDDGLALLRKEMASNKASQELKMRVAVALGRAGDDSVRAQLIDILQDGRYHVGAADALAALGDPAAVPALIRQLDLASLRVRAALWLRQLGIPVDLANLAAAMDTGSNPARVSAAEAILILAGPAELAEFE